MIAEASGRLTSFNDAAFALELAGVPISSRQVHRIAQEIGDEMTQQRDHKTERQRRRQLPVRVAATPQAVAVEVDGGRLRTREPGCGPGVHNQENKEAKAACLATLQSQVHPQDPQPQPPPSFLRPRRVQRLVQQMRKQATDQPQAEGEPEDEATAVQREADESVQPHGPQRLVRTCLASMVDSHEFGRQMAAEAQERGFYQAKRQAFVADGAAYNWWIGRTYFQHFEPIVDFLHVLCYVYQAAWAVGSTEGQRWSLYEGWMTACWQGRVTAVIEELTQWQERLGEPPKEEELDQKDPQSLVAEALSYLGNNQERMDYPRYRQQGLPVTSSLVESLVGEFNARVKSREKFWDRPQGAEQILQLRAAVLSEDERLERHFEQRPGCPYRRHRPQRKVA
jgi:hypothetical protein